MSKIDKITSKYSNEAISDTFLNPENIENPNSSLLNLKMLRNMQLNDDDLKEIQLAFAGNDEENDADSNPINDNVNEEKNDVEPMQENN